VNITVAMPRMAQTEISVANQLLLREGERQYAGKAAKKKEGPSDPQASALADIFWAVLNSNEFILQH